MEDKTRMVRKLPIDGPNSIYMLDALFVTEVWQADPFEAMKYYYNIKDKKLTVLGDVEAIYVHY
jgi:hypothetical protein